MLIGKDYKIESDSMNTTISKRKINDKTGKEYWATIGFFSDAKWALKKLVDLELSETELKDLTTITKKQAELYRLIEGLKGLPEAPQSTPGVFTGQKGGIYRKEVNSG